MQKNCLKPDSKTCTIKKTHITIKRKRSNSKDLRENTATFGLKNIAYGAKYAQNCALKRVF